MTIVPPDDNPSDEKEERRSPFPSRRIFDHRITVSHILTTLTIAATILYSGTQIKERVRVLEEQKTNIHIRMDRINRNHTDDINQLRAEFSRQYNLLIRMEDKLDAMQDRIANINNSNNQ